MPSTAIKDLTCARTRRGLSVTFAPKGDKVGRRYRYFDVPPDEAAAFRRARSKGGFFNARVRDRYDYEEEERD